MMRDPIVLSLTAAAMLSFPQPAGWPAVAVADHRSEIVGPGVRYDRFELTTADGPLIVHVTTVDLRDPSVVLSVVTQHDRIGGPGEALSAMADRAGAEAAINGDYFDIDETGIPLNVAIADGDVLHQPDGAAAMFIGPGDDVSFGPMTFRASFEAASGASAVVTSVNDWTASTAIAMLTPRLGLTAAYGATEVVLTRVPGGSTFRVSAVDAGLDELVALAPDQIAIAGHDKGAIAALGRFEVGDTVAQTVEAAPSLDGIAAAIGGGPLLLKGGSTVVDPLAPAPEEAGVRYPVSGAGVSADGATLWLVAVDGENRFRSIGITRPMLAALFVALGAGDAIALDSGGSTEMAVRHLGDAGVSVANTPSDGHERWIADALAVRNVSPVGPLAALLLYPDAQAVLVGSHVRVRAEGIDAGDQPLPIVARAAVFSEDNAAAGAIDADGILVALAPGVANVGAMDGPIVAQPVAIEVVASAASAAIAGAPLDIVAGAIAHLSLAAQTADGRPIAIDRSAVTWSSTGDGLVSADGTFTAGGAPGTAVVVAQASGAKASATLLVGDHTLVVQSIPVAGTGIGQWRFAANSSAVSGALDATPAPDGSAALHLSYAFVAGAGTRAAYVDVDIALDASPTAASVDVYGDGGGEWLRGAYRDATGVVGSVTLARHVDWTGWKTVRAPLLPLPAYPITWTRLYVVEPRRDAVERGDLWFRDLGIIYPGPEQVGP
jgi:exopolysaccharide biosynthesis protein